MHTQKLYGEFQQLSLKILDSTKKIVPNVDYLEEFLTLLRGFSNCDIIELWLSRPERKTSYIFTRKTALQFAYSHNFQPDSSWQFFPVLEAYQEFEQLCYAFLASFIPFPGKSIHYRWQEGAYRFITYEGDMSQPSDHKNVRGETFYKSDHSTLYQTIDCYPIKVGEELVGLLSFFYKRRRVPRRAEIESYQNLMWTVGFVLVKQSSLSALNERIKELTCLYGIARLAEQPQASLNDIFTSALTLLPPAWQFPDIAQSRILYGDKEYKSQFFVDSPYKQSSSIIVNGHVLGRIEVVYTEIRPQLDEGPFLVEERNLLNAIAREFGHLIERR
ncbi:MAG: hypothetical protein JW795_23105, partial [Chitinivibrionales bacterium]|nr:hypothetical protein [Chitinivibrionales bacterium]